jgi:hypothetical protein
VFMKGCRASIVYSWRSAIGGKRAENMIPGSSLPQVAHVSPRTYAHPRSGIYAKASAYLLRISSMAHVST